MVQSAGIRVYDEGGGGGGGTVSDGVVQLEGGSAYAGDDGGEAALFDQTGTQILGRTAVRHWLDPHPDAAAFDETWEFSTTGDMTQGQLETAGWTFTNCTAEVASGILWLTASSTAVVTASIAVSLAGDFDFLFSPVYNTAYDAIAAGTYYCGGGGIADSSGDVAHYGAISNVNGRGRAARLVNGTFTGLAGTTTTVDNYTVPSVIRVSRVSGTVYIAHGPALLHLLRSDETAFEYYSWTPHASVSDSTTFNKVFLTPDANASTSGSVGGFHFIRRFQ